MGVEVWVAGSGIRMEVFGKEASHPLLPMHQISQFSHTNHFKRKLGYKAR